MRQDFLAACAISGRACRNPKRERGIGPVPSLTLRVSMAGALACQEILPHTPRASKRFRRNLRRRLPSRIPPGLARCTGDGKGWLCLLRSGAIWRRSATGGLSLERDSGGDPTRNCGTRRDEVGFEHRYASVCRSSVSEGKQPACVGVRHRGAQVVPSGTEISGPPGGGRYSFLSASHSRPIFTSSPDFDSETAIWGSVA